MILFKFAGGLGNQMFQFAMFTALREKLSYSNVLAEVSFYCSTKEAPKLAVEKAYGIKIPYSKISSMNFPVANKLTHRFIYSGIRLISKTGVLQKVRDDNHYKPSVFDLNIKENYLFEGYWADQRYFFDIREKLYDIFDPGLPTDEKNISVLDEILNSDSVSVHIRRGDYLKSDTFINLSESDYYQKSIEHVSSNLQQPKYFVFSDDINWCKERFEELNISNVVFVDHNSGDKAFWDIYLMSKCKANILANSTFSWWGGWLNQNEDKIIVCPARLFKSIKRNDLIVPQFYPESWVKII